MPTVPLAEPRSCRSQIVQGGIKRLQIGDDLSIQGVDDVPLKRSD
jgi:hypothetical protein